MHCHRISIEYPQNLYWIELIEAPYFMATRCLAALEVSDCEVAVDALLTLAWLAGLALSGKPWPIYSLDIRT